MIITISGKPGSGKSTIAKLLAKMLKYRHYSMGDLQRSIAEEKGISLIELSKLEEKDPSIDREVDRKQKELGEKKDNFVIDSRIGFHFIPKSVKIYLDISLDESVKRISKDKRAGEAGTVEELKAEIKRRMQSETKRYKKYYGADISKLSNYDLVVDTSKLTIEQVFEKVASFIKKFK
jgi:cytidylate kinase